MGDVVQSAIQEGIRDVAKETKQFYINLRNSYLPSVTKWIADAKRSLEKDTSLRNKTFKTDNGQGNLRPGVLFFTRDTYGGLNYESKLRDLWGVVSKSASQALRSRSIVGTDISEELLNRTLLTRGYYILTKVGEAIRGDEVMYKVIVHDNSGGVINRVTEWTLNLKNFLDKATHLADGKNYYSTGIRDNEILRQTLGLYALEEKEWNQEEIGDFLMFLKLVRGYVELWGDVEKHPLASKVNNANMGNLIEAYLLLGFVYRYRKKGEKSEWLEVRAQFDAISSILDTLKKPSSFWLGGEGGPKLLNILVKTNSASLTNMNTLVRQMTRLYSILIALPSDTEQKVITDGFNKAGLSFVSDNEVIEALINMFERDYASSVARIDIII